MQPVPERPQPSGEMLLNGDVAQEPFEKASLLLLEQLKAASKELAQSQEVLWRLRLLGLASSCSPLPAEQS